MVRLFDNVNFRDFVRLLAPFSPKAPRAERAKLYFQVTFTYFRGGMGCSRVWDGVVKGYRVRHGSGVAGWWHSWVRQGIVFG